MSIRRLLPLAFLLLTAFAACSSPAEEVLTPGTDSESAVLDESLSEANPLVPGSNPGEGMYKKVCVEGTDQKGPWENDLVLQWVTSSGAFTKAKSQNLVEAGGVPTVMQDDEGRLIAAFQWFACGDEEAFDKIAVVISEDDGATWSDPESIQIEDYPEDFIRPFDPTLVLLPNGKIRLYYTAGPSSSRILDKNTNIYSAISSDGVNYTFEKGIRFDLDDQQAYDVAVGYWDELWHLIVPNNVKKNNGGAFHATSKDGLDFTQVDDLDFTTDKNWTGNFYAGSDGLYFYGTSGSDGNWFVKTSDGETWDGPTAISTRGGDPAVYCLSQDKCLMITVQMPKEANGANAVKQ